MIVTAGEMLVEFVSHRLGCGLTQTTEYSGPHPSGAPAIFLDQAARVGVDTKLFGGVGEDPFGQALLARLANDGVNTEGVCRHPDKTTGTAFVSYYPDGSRVFVFHLNDTAADHFDTSSDLPQPATLHVSGSSLGNGRIRAPIMALVEEVAPKGKISFDPNVRPELLQDEAARSAINHLIGKASIFLPSEADLEFLFPGRTLDRVFCDLHDEGKDIVVVKRGSLGVIASDGNTRFDVPGHPVKEVDPTGAGDCFCGILVGLLEQGVPLERALNLANAGAALHVTRRGPMEWNPSLQEIEDFLQTGEDHDVARKPC